MGAAGSIAQQEGLKPVDASDVLTLVGATRELAHLREFIRAAYAVTAALQAAEVEATGGGAASDGLANDVLVQHGIVLVEEMKYGDAELYFRTVLELNPKHTVAFRQYHDLLFAHILRKDGIAAATPELRNAVSAYWRDRAEEDDASALSLVWHGYLLRRLEKDDGGAEACFRRAIAVDPGYSPAHYNLGRLTLKAHNDFVQAEECFREAVRLDPNDALSTNHLGHLCFELENFDEAERCYRRALAIDPRHSHAHNNLGLLLETVKNDLEGAEECYRAAMQIDPHDVVAHYNLGKLLHSVKLDFQVTTTLTDEERASKLARLDNDAESCFRKAIAIDPSDALAHNNLAFLLHNVRGSYAEAKKAYEAAIEIDPTDICFLFNLGHLLLHDMHMYSDAQATYVAILEIVPGNENARKLLDEAVSKAETAPQKA
jgi:tetratricopeptide (TPR) repeat protein|tara:strand:+ start:1181 stop:2473 length:1293 start_codon:yes stop_codon:yes gene_type:complete